MTQTLIFIITIVLLLPGLVGVILPVLPGIPYMLVVAVLFAWLTKFAVLTGFELGWLALLTLMSVLVDYFSGVLGAKFGGASGKSLVIGIIGFLLGTILLPPLGGLLGMFIGIAVSEIYFFGHTKTAIRAAGGGVLGSLAGMILNLLIGVVFLVLFIIFAL